MSSTTANATTRQPRSSDATRAYRHRRISVTEEEDIDLPMTDAESPPPSPTPNRPSPSLRRTTTKEKNSSGSEGGGAQPSTFPFKLHEMLEYASSCDSAQMKSACFWSPSGAEFVISDKDVMMEDLAPMFFKQTKFRSFVSSSSVTSSFLLLHDDNAQTLTHHSIPS